MRRRRGVVVAVAGFAAAVDAGATGAAATLLAAVLGGTAGGAFVPVVGLGAENSGLSGSARLGVDDVAGLGGIVTVVTGFLRAAATPTGVRARTRVGVGEGVVDRVSPRGIGGATTGGAAIVRRSAPVMSIGRESQLATAGTGTGGGDAGGGGGVGAS